MATQDIDILTKEHIKELSELSEKLEDGNLLEKMRKGPEKPGETFNWKKGGILPAPDETIYGPPKNDWKIDTGDFMEEITEKTIKDFMKEHFPGLNIEQIVEICKEKFPENYV